MDFTSLVSTPLKSGMIKSQDTILPQEKSSIVEMTPAQGKVSRCGSFLYGQVHIAGKGRKSTSYLFGCLTEKRGPLSV